MVVVPLPIIARLLTGTGVEPATFAGLARLFIPLQWITPLVALVILIVARVPPVAFVVVLSAPYFALHGQVMGQVPLNRAAELVGPGFSLACAGLSLRLPATTLRVAIAAVCLAYYAAAALPWLTLYAERVLTPASRFPRDGRPGATQLRQ